MFVCNGYEVTEKFRGTFAIVPVDDIVNGSLGDGVGIVERTGALLTCVGKETRIQMMLPC